MYITNLIYDVVFRYIMKDNSVVKMWQENSFPTLPEWKSLSWIKKQRFEY
jgi:hypothetical protein